MLAAFNFEIVNTSNIMAIMLSVGQEDGALVAAGRVSAAVDVTSGRFKVEHSLNGVYRTAIDIS